MKYLLNLSNIKSHETTLSSYSTLVVAAQAQTIAEKDLLGSWKFAKMDFDGILANLETGEVTLSPAQQEAAKNKDQEIEVIKEMLASEMGVKIKSNRLTFKPEYVLESSDGVKTDTGSYSLATTDGRQYIELNVGIQMKMEVRLESGFLKLIPPDGNKNIMFLKKI